MRCITWRRPAIPPEASIPSSSRRGHRTLNLMGLMPSIQTETSQVSETCDIPVMVNVTCRIACGPNLTDHISPTPPTSPQT